MYKFGQEITPVLSGTTWPVQVAQYDRYIQKESGNYSLATIGSTIASQGSPQLP
jgi:hypothetical protein